VVILARTNPIIGNMKQLAILFLGIALNLAAFAQLEAEPFMPEVFADMPYVRDIAISPNGEEIFFTVDDYRHKVGLIVRIKADDGGWSAPEAMPFSGRFRDIEPALTADGLRLYFASNRPLDPESRAIKDYDLYYVERESLDASWGEVIRLPGPINTAADEYYPSLTDNGDLYFTAAREGGAGGEDIYEAPFSNGVLGDPFVAEGGLNTGGYEYNAFVSPDNQYIIFSSYRHRDGRNRNDLYICFRDGNGTWGEAQLVPGIYSDAIDYCPYVDRNTGLLYFTSERNVLAPGFDEPLDYDSFMHLVKTSPNGLGRIYTVDFSEILRQLGR
jgi:hypothetical protein